jgi:hypothetical protein
MARRRLRSWPLPWQAVGYGRSMDVGRALAERRYRPLGSAAERRGDSLAASALANSTLGS